MIELTLEQQKILDRRAGFPPRVVDPRSGETYLLLPAGLYERVRGILEEEDEIREVEEMLPLAAEVLNCPDDSSTKESA